MIQNIVNDKFYIGSTLNWYNRKRTHLNKLRGGRHSNKYLQRAWDKYGENAFRFEILERLDDFDNQSLRDAEHWWIHNTHCLQPHGYNLSKSSCGYEFTEAHKKAMSMAHKGQVPWTKGRHFSEDHRMKLKASVTRALQSKPNRIVQVSAEAKEKSLVKGVYWHKRGGKWTVQFKGKHYGIFRERSDAEALAMQIGAA